MKRTETIIETQEVWVIRRRTSQPQAPCPDCAGQSQLLTPEEAAQLFSLSLRAIYRLVEAGSVHFLETADNRLFICPASLCDAVAEAARPKASSLYMLTE